MRKVVTDVQLAILRVMAGKQEWWTPSNFQHPHVPVHYQTAAHWSLPKLKALAVRSLVEKRQGYDRPFLPDYCYRITALGRAAVVQNAARAVKLVQR